MGKRPPSLTPTDHHWIEKTRMRDGDEFDALRNSLLHAAFSINDGGEVNTNINHTLIIGAPPDKPHDWVISTSLLLSAHNIAYPNRAIEHSVHHDEEGDVIVIHGKEMLTRLARLGVVFPQSALYLHFHEQESRLR